MLDKLDKIESLRGRQAKIAGVERAFASAVLLPLVNIDGQTCVGFEKRAAHLLHQPSEISFPGGKIEALDASPEAAAVRETCEELGLFPKNIEVIAPLDVEVSPFNAIIYPFCGHIDDYRQVKPDPDEVAEVFYVPLDYLIENKPIKHNMWMNVEANQDFPFELIPQGKEYPFRKAYIPQLFWVWHEHVIWGLTARILNNFINLLRD